MIKNYPLYDAMIKPSQLKVIVYRYSALFIVVTFALAQWLSQVMIVAIGASALLNLLLFEYGLRTIDSPLNEISFNDVALVVIREPSGCFSGEITDNSLVCDWLCLLIIKRHGCRQLLWRVVWRDMIDDQAYRRLSRVVRIKRRLI